MNEQRDAELATRLDELEVREHGPGYWKSVLAAADPELACLRAERRRRRRRLRLWAPLAAAAAAAAIVLAVALSGSGPGGGPQAVQPASAAEAIGYTLNVIDQYPGLAGTITLQSVGGLPANQYEYTQRFIVARDGSLQVDERRVEAAQAPKGTTLRAGYDASAHRDQSLLDDSEFFPLPADQPSEGTHPYWWSQQTHLAPGPPDIGTGGWPPLWRLRAYLRSIQGDPAVSFATSTKDGRAVWVLRTSVVEVVGSDKRASAVALPVSIVIDAATRLPISYWRSAVPDGSASSGETIFFDIKPLESAPASDTFSIPVPKAPGVYVEREYPAGDQGFRRLDGGDPARAGKATFGVAAFPAWVPEGFRVSDAATKLDGWTQYPRNAPVSRPLVPVLIVSQAFRRGWDQLFVSVRTDSRLNTASNEKIGGKWVRIDTSDPFLPSIEPAVRAEWRLHTTDVRLTRGAFAGATAHVVIEPEHWPHLWVRKGPWVATVAGDLTRAEMIRVAESLGPWNAAGGE
jgi:hypothetical protein